MGSKARFSKEILPIILKERLADQYYIEPFAGGMNMICNVGGPRIANDINYYLVEMWRALINGWVPPQVTKQEYQDIRQNKEKYPPFIVGWAGFNCSYSGKWFGGFAGEVKTKTGDMRDYQLEAVKNVAKQIDKLRGVEFCNKSYDQLILPPNSIIYCDPPYKGTTQYESDFDHNKFWQWARLTSENHILYVSKYSAPEDFQCIWQAEVKSSLSANGRSGGSKTSTERLFKLSI